MEELNSPTWISSKRVCTPSVVSLLRPPKAVPKYVAGAARDPALVGLLELVAVDRVVQEIGEVVVELERRLDYVGVDLRGAARVALPPVRGQRIRWRAAVGVVDLAEALELPSETARTGTWSVEYQESI